MISVMQLVFYKCLWIELLLSVVAHWCDYCQQIRECCTILPLFIELLGM